jgi:hypothetical protein
MEELRGSIDAEANRVGQLRERLEREGVEVGIAELKGIWNGRLRSSGACIRSSTPLWPA